MSEFINKAKGKLKQAVAELTGDKRLKREGKTDEVKGKLEGAAAHAKSGVKSAMWPPRKNWRPR